MKCPRCGREEEKMYGVSRYDNETHVCSSCSVNEAMFVHAHRDDDVTLPPLDQEVYS